MMERRLHNIRWPAVTGSTRVHVGQGVAGVVIIYPAFLSRPLKLHVANTRQTYQKSHHEAVNSPENTKHLDYICTILDQR